MTECRHCDGFGFVPAGIGSGWYRRDWRLMLDPTLDWERCNFCYAQQSPLSHLHECLAKELRHRLLSEIKSWLMIGGWQYGVAGECHEAAGQISFLWRDMICLPPGPMTQFNDWLIVSRLGTLRLPNIEQTEYHLSRARSPELPRRELWP
ncbi:MAG: hypothetical protein F6K62_19555 [Sphaerospermopsis sp. SIO1G2]|nr:hypothetical protein [Sphaerospermopsis sp. SIO1G2]